ncbi:hypothetical protein O3G_MSEX011803 [Manduca sexta]|uniref:Serpin domain-containing protein n=1 Tax=Manduca sexta TaxID=7130 RepID=A0A921ZM19_MANSE|nr:hypothetical protein O3G_MSEX011803 [Manduca sexta]KAG6460139.1 hypothetical protein O3G_MSEX011803 [Manduca sexta]
MLKLTLVLAVLANLGLGTAEPFFDILSNLMNKAINPRNNDCRAPSTDKYTEACSEINEGYDYADLMKSYNDATTAISGVSIYQWQRTHEGVSQLSSVGALMLVLSKLSQNAVDETRSQLYNLINLDNSKEVRYLIPKVAKEHSATSGDFISTLTTKVFSDKVFSKNFIKCTNEVIMGETGVLDYNNPSAAAEEINSWFGEQTRFDRADVVTAADVRNDSGLIFATCHNLEFEFDQFIFSELVNISFYISEDNVTTLPVWKGEGKAKYSFNDKLQAHVVQLPLKGDGTLVVIKPPIGRVPDLLYYLRDNRNFANLLAESQETYLKLYQPLNDYVVRSHDSVLGLKLANQLTQIYFDDFDGFRGILENGSGYVTNMFHQIHMSIKGLGQNAITSDCGENAKEVVIDSGFVFYVIGPSGGAPELCGTHLS